MDVEIQNQLCFAGINGRTALIDSTYFKQWTWNNKLSFKNTSQLKNRRKNTKLSVKIQNQQQVKFSKEEFLKKQKHPCQISQILQIIYGETIFSGNVCEK
eukprot:TRINITY_DN38172_c0_g1_i1.p4 TRINITY_DN38172_c0_g1~~TRINITY_DN38172_c0_g1_i1.p4  ORF type:complete len:100 (+),score=6.82 TRINITY_DN38172_c0_g1_i1:562-861(+)